MYLVSDAMSPEPLTLSPDDSTDRARQLMKNGRLRHLPVVHHGKLVGLVTQRDLLERPEVAGVREGRVTAVPTATPGTPLRKAARTLYEQRFGCLPVVDEQRAVVGILTATDFIRFAADIAAEFDRVEATASRLGA